MNNKFEIQFATAEDVKVFCSKARKRAFDIDIQSGNYMVDGKSILGLFSLNLSKRLTVICHTDDPDAVSSFKIECSRYVA